MKSFEEAWEELGYNYGEDALENVKLGWEMAFNTLKAQEPDAYLFYIRSKNKYGTVNTYSMAAIDYTLDFDSKEEIINKIPLYDIEFDK